MTRASAEASYLEPTGGYQTKTETPHEVKKTAKGTKELTTPVSFDNLINKLK